MAEESRTVGAESCNAPAAVEQIQFLRDKLQKFQSKMLCDFEQRLSCMIEDVLQDLRQQELRAHEFRQFEGSRGRVANPSSTWHNRQQHTSSKLPESDVSDSPNWRPDAQNQTTPKQQQQQQQRREQQEPQQRTRRQLPDKVFLTRESYLTALLQVEHMRTIYHIFSIILVMFLLNAICYDYFVDGHINLGLGTFRGGLRRLHWVLGVWLLEHVFVLALYFAFQGWALVRAKLPSHRKSNNNKNYSGSDLVSSLPLSLSL